MIAQSRIRHLGWFAVLAICTALCCGLMLKVHAVHSEVVRSERRIVDLEQQKLLLETELETRASLLQLAAWNRVDFGYVAPSAAQFIDNERQLARLGGPRADGAPEPIRVAESTGEMPEYPKLVSPMTGKPMDEAGLPIQARAEEPAPAASPGAVRVKLAAAWPTSGARATR